MFENGQGNTAETDEQSPGYINPGVDPTTVTDDSSPKNLVERVLFTIKVRFMF